MSDEVQDAAPEVMLSPQEYIRTKYPNSPSDADVAAWKAQVPGGRIRFFEFPDRKRAAYLRAISPLELAAIQADAAKTENPQKQLFDVQAAIASKCTVWASFTSSGKLMPQDFNTQGAGLPVTLHAVIWDFSDYIDPSVIDNLVIDL